MKNISNLYILNDIVKSEIYMYNFIGGRLWNYRVPAAAATAAAAWSVSRGHPVHVITKCSTQRPRCGACACACSLLIALFAQMCFTLTHKIQHFCIPFAEGMLMMGRSLQRALGEILINVPMNYIYSESASVRSSPSLVSLLQSKLVS